MKDEMWTENEQWTELEKKMVEKRIVSEERNKNTTIRTKCWKIIAGGWVC